MSYPPELLTWTEEVSRRLPHLTARQARVLAWYNLAITVVQSCEMRHVAYFLACLLGHKENTMRQRLVCSLLALRVTPSSRVFGCSSPTSRLPMSAPPLVEAYWQDSSCLIFLLSPAVRFKR